MSGGITPTGQFAFQATVVDNPGGAFTNDALGVELTYAYQLPQSPAGDLFEATEGISGRGNSSIRIGNNPPFTYHSYAGGTETISAAQSVSIFGDWSTGAFYANGDGFDKFLDITRIHADGTPDPFAVTPEPTPFGLAGVGLLAGLCH